MSFAAKILSAINQFEADSKDWLIEDYTPEEIDEMPIGNYIRFALDWLGK